jgi:hypothetical protein
MVWRKADPSDPDERVLVSVATTMEGVIRDLRTVIDAMARRPQPDAAGGSRGILICVNATEGHLMLSWLSPVSGDIVLGGSHFLGLEEMWTPVMDSHHGLARWQATVLAAIRVLDARLQGAEAPLRLHVLCEGDSAAWPATA